VERTLRGDLEAPTRVVPPTSECETTILRSRRSRRSVVVAGIVALATTGALGLGLTSGGGSTPTTTRTPPPKVASIPQARTAAQAARNLSRWLRRNAR
jgi:hypothetical protein